MIAFRETRCVAAAFLAMLFNSLPARATDIPVMGEKGAHGFHTACPPGNFMVGLQVRAGAWVDQLSIKCASVGKDGATGNPTTMEPHGGPNGGPQSGPDTCGAGAVISGMHVSFTPNEKQVRSFVLDCRSEGNGNIAQNITVGAKATSALKDQVCPPGELAVGLNGNEGLAVNAVGLICVANPKQGVTTGAEQSLQQKCQQYATQAVSEFKEYAGRSCGPVPSKTDPNRWTDNFQGHKAWCLSLGSNSAAADKEDGERRGLLSQCSTSNPLVNPAAPHLAIQGQPGNTLLLTGSGFLSNAPISIRVVSAMSGQALITSIGGAPIKSSGAQSLSVTLVGLCKVNGDQLTFTATDGRENGNLWSNSVLARCT